MHKGKIEVESEYGKGSTFSIYLPMGKNHLKENEISKGKFKLNDFSFDVGDIESAKYEINTSDTFIDESIYNHNELENNTRRKKNDFNCRG